MMGTLKVAQGRIEEAVGALVGSDKLRARGRKDQLIGHAGQTGETLVDQAREKARAVKKNLKTTGGIAKGRIEEAAGVLVGSEKLRVKGQKDQIVGRIRKDAETTVRVAKASARKKVDEARAIVRVPLKKAGR